LNVVAATPPPLWFHTTVPASAGSVGSVNDRSAPTVTDPNVCVTTAFPPNGAMSIDPASIEPPERLIVPWDPAFDATVSTPGNAPSGATMNRPPCEFSVPTDTSPIVA
jgi:hypothetical protein